MKTPDEFSYWGVLCDLAVSLKPALTRPTKCTALVEHEDGNQKYISCYVYGGPGDQRTSDFPPDAVMHWAGLTMDDWAHSRLPAAPIYLTFLEAAEIIDEDL